VIRAQLTIPDLVYFAAGLVALAGLAPVLYAVLDSSAGDLGTGSAFLYQAIVPGLVVTMLIILFAIASGGGQ